MDTKIAVFSASVLVLSFGWPLTSMSADADKVASSRSMNSGRHFFCPDKAQHYFEEIYCQIKQANPISPLPSARDFRHNTRKIQQLILKPLAKKYGVPFNPSLLKKSDHSLTKTHSSIQNNNNAKSTTTAHLPPYPGKRITAKERVTCTLEHTQISCSDHAHFLLATNKTNGQLKKGALGDTNKMELRDYPGDLTNKRELSLFMTAQYNQYLEKMLNIGLGGTTLSYNKFVDIFYLTQQSNQRFSHRFETMYGALKKDKATIGTPKSDPPSNNFTINNCQQISSRLFTCADTVKNHVYVKP